jgi:hypothetical protein
MKATRRILGAMVLAMLLSLTAFLAPAKAQLACSSISITNNSDVAVNLTFTNGEILYRISNITPGTALYQGPAFTPTGFISAHDHFVSLADACSDCITLQESAANASICAHVCSASACSITITRIPCSNSCQ